MNLRDQTGKALGYHREYSQVRFSQRDMLVHCQRSLWAQGVRLTVRSFPDSYPHVRHGARNMKSTRHGKCARCGHSVHDSRLRSHWHVRLPVSYLKLCDTCYEGLFRCMGCSKVRESTSLRVGSNGLPLPKPLLCGACFDRARQGNFSFQDESAYSSPGSLNSKTTEKEEIALSCSIRKN